MRAFGLSGILYDIFRCDYDDVKQAIVMQGELYYNERTQECDEGKMPICEARRCQGR